MSGIEFWIRAIRRLVNDAHGQKYAIDAAIEELVSTGEIRDRGDVCKALAEAGL